MSRYILPFLFLIAFSTLPAAAQDVWQGDSVTVNFTAKHFGVGVDGTIVGFEGEVLFDAANPAKSNLQGTLEVATVNTGNKTRDKNLRKEKYFNVEEYPRMSMKLLSAKEIGPGKYQGTFELKIKGTSKEIEIPFTLEDSGNTGNLSTSFEISRKEFDVGGSMMFLSDDVSVNISAKIRPMGN